MPKIPQNYVVNWCLMHPGMNHSGSKTRQHYSWPNLQENFLLTLRFAKIVRKTKQKNKYGHLPAKEA